MKPGPEASAGPFVSGDRSQCVGVDVGLQLDRAGSWCGWQLSITASVLVGRSVYLPSNLSDLEYPRSGANHLVGGAGSRH